MSSVDKDAEIERLREELDALELGYIAQQGHGRRHWLRAEAAEAKLARVERVVHDAEKGGFFYIQTHRVRTALADAPAWGGA